MKFPPEKLPMIRQQLAIDFNISETVSADELLQELAACVNKLINSDFSKLIAILYRIDIPETAVATVLQQQAGTDAGILIAQLILERQLQKQLMREQFTTQRVIPDDEKW
jgi:hypothetical protein